MDKNSHDTIENQIQKSFQSSSYTLIDDVSEDLLEKYQQKPKRDHSAPPRRGTNPKLKNSRQNTDLIVIRKRDDSAPRSTRVINSATRNANKQQVQLDHQLNFNEEINSLPNFEYISLEEKEFIENFISQSENEIFNLKKENSQLKSILQSVKIKEPEPAKEIEMNRQNLIQQTSFEMTNLISEVTHLKATEQILAKKLDDERLKNMQLNEAVLGLQKKLNDNETTINNAQRSSENENVYYEVIEALKSEGFDDKVDNQELVVYLYEQRCELVRQLNDILFYIRQLGIECEEPIEGMKKLFEEVKSYKNEIEFLNDQIWTNKAEQKYQVFELENKIKTILNEREALIDRLKEHSRLSYADEKSLQYASDNDGDMTETETQRHFRSSLEVITTKVVNIPIELEQGSIADADQTLENDKKSTKLASSSKENLKSESVGELKVELLQKEIEKLEKLNASLQSEIKQAESQRIILESQLKNNENDNKSLEFKYQQKIQILNEKMEQIQGEYEKHKIEHNEYKQKHKMKTYELKKKIEQYEAEMLQLNKKFNLHEIEIEKLKYEVNHKLEENLKLHTEIKQLNEYKEKSIHLEEKLHSEQNHSQTLVNKIQHLEHDLKTFNKTLIEQQNGMQTSNEKILDNFKSIIKEQIESNKTQSFTKCDIDELKMRIKELQFKLSQEKLAKESLEIKLKLLESDNQSLRQTLLNSCRLKTTLTNRNRIDEINELIERAQLNAQNIIAGNPSLLSLVEIK